MTFFPFAGAPLHEQSVEHHAILAVLLGYGRVHEPVADILNAAAAVLYRAGALAGVLNNSHAVGVSGSHADRPDDNATRDREESMHSQRRGEKWSLDLNFHLAYAERK